MYGHHLLTGHTIHSKSIKADTASKYLLAAATLLCCFDTIPGRDGRKKFSTDKGMCNEINMVLKEARRYEAVPDRREAFTLAMQQALRTECKDHDPDSLEPALTDWFNAGLLGGFRKSEWCQERKHTRVGLFNPSPKGDPTAFTLDDVKFFDEGGSEIPHTAAITDRPKAKRVIIRWRWQKNGDVNVTKGYSRSVHINLDPVEAWLNIVARFFRLMPHGDGTGPVTTLPISIYRKDVKKINNITDLDVEKSMRSLAKSVYGITAKKALSKFTCHSVRVGACCVLQAAGAAPEYIKKQLRWNSDSWQIYTRDLCILSHQHNEILFQESLQPVQRW